MTVTIYTSGLNILAHKGLTFRSANEVKHHLSNKDAHGRTVHRKTREVKGIDQNDTLNRALWRLSVEVAKLAA